MKEKKSLSEMKEEIDKRTKIERYEYGMKKKEKEMYNKRNEAMKIKRY